ncbi:phosphatidate cytidylyltransferase [Aquabacter sp. L1I39]|uniref:phosphatidate cytidylyltransferase n=1 Tax=Aquabacter sp. L1I39 TaxID=2820278 RepID=UPI001ADC99F4|nr:phosphatidate cytidylyltransferase [Aquabacter sp. L1I39]QTL03617.1 phosphatidate cytidylyltransferase [Aquabacter sp. L1I39]
MSGNPDLKQRTLSALVLAPLVLGLTYWGGSLFAALWLCAAASVAYEWAKVASIGPRVPYVIGAGATLCTGVAALMIHESALALPLLVAGVLVCAAFARPAGWSAAGVLCAAVVCLPVIVLRGEDRLGLTAVLFLYGVVWGTDIGAYFAGRAIGGPKLAPHLSPNKTWSGAVGGALIGTAAGCGLLVASGLYMAPVLVVLGAFISIASQAGDLAESAFKRAFGVKDTSRLIPGHGGVLDRVDGFMAAALLAFLIGFAHNPASPAAGLLLW